MQTNKGFSKGKWYFNSWADVPHTNIRVEVDEHADQHIAFVNSHNSKIDSQVIITAINALQTVNPENPQAVAESIKDMYEGLRYALKCFRKLSESGHYPEFMLAENNGQGFRPIIKALEGADGQDYSHGLDDLYKAEVK